MDSQLRHNFPQIAALNHELTEFGGFITVLNEDVYVHIILEKKDCLKKFSLKGHWKLQQLLEPVNESLMKCLSHCTSLSMFLNELQSVLEQRLRLHQRFPISSPPPNYYSTLLGHLDACGWDKVHLVDSELNKVQLKAVDEAEREHYLLISLPQEYPNKPPEWNADIPVTVDVKWNKNTTLLDVYKEFQCQLILCQQFWSCMEELDQEAWVLEPDKPSRHDCRRRLALTTNASIQITVAPMSPRSIPVCHFLGPERVVGPLKEKFGTNSWMWNDNFSLIVNLQKLLDMELPSPANTSREDFSVECGICYTYRLSDSLPDKSCEDQRCNRPFHHLCLYEWLRTLPSTRHSFNILFGECPYCSKPIMCTIP